jgi:pimeloyl-ACP methyl ester carboxylesterase
MPPDSSHSVTQSLVTAAGHRLRVEEIRPAGAGMDAPTLVFLHEGLGSILHWRDVPRRLSAATELPAIVYERWGFGGSDPLSLPRPDDYLEREATQALPELLAACGVGRHILIGHSDGGTIALLYAAERPGGLLGAVCEAAHVFVEDCAIRGIERAVEAWRNTDLPRRLARYHGEKAESVFRGWADTWLRPSFRNWRMTERLPAVCCPLLVVQGADDAYGTLAQVEAIAAGTGGQAETLVVPDCGHTPHLEAPDIVLPAIECFIARRIRAAAPQ